LPDYRLQSSSQVVMDISAMKSASESRCRRLSSICTASGKQIIAARAEAAQDRAFDAKSVLDIECPIEPVIGSRMAADAQPSCT
jgi:hypothetical protein